MAFTKGDTVVQVVTPIKGRVAGWGIDSESGVRQVLVEWSDADGTLHSRYFRDEEIELAPVEPAAPAA